MVPVVQSSESAKPNKRDKLEKEHNLHSSWVSAPLTAVHKASDLQPYIAHILFVVSVFAVWENYMYEFHIYT